MKLVYLLAEDIVHVTQIDGNEGSNVHICMDIQNRRNNATHSKFTLPQRIQEYSVVTDKLVRKMKLQNVSTISEDELFRKVFDYVFLKEGGWQDIVLDRLEEICNFGEGSLHFNRTTEFVPFVEFYFKSIFYSNLHHFFSL
jgi:hypothetical protein